jgi:steroid 5-alpha reductase family enzyme
MAESMSLVFFESAIFFGIHIIVWFMISIFLKRNDVADIGWGMGYVLLCMYHAFTKPIHPVEGVCYLLTITWGIRLSVHLFNRNRHKSEDFRYLQWRRDWGSSFYVRSFFQVYVLQSLILFLIISPVLYSASFATSQWSIFTVIGIVVWLIGFYWQVVGDRELAIFIAERKDKDDILKTGLWSYSRHPNYFGEVVMWWGIYLVVWPLSGSLVFIIGPLTITLLIRYVSGVPMLERKYAGNKAYQAYKMHVPVLFPRIPFKS